MAINQNAETIKPEEVKVVSARKFENGGIVANIIVRGITIYNMSYHEKDGKSWFSFPQRKGSDNKYYAHCYFKITEDVQKHIEKEVEKLL